MSGDAGAAAVAERRVLSVQSHVVHGYVGNKCATFSLQVLGFDVDAIHTVSYSTHLGYPLVRGDKLSGDQLLALLEGLRANSLVAYSHLLTGYIGSAGTLRAALEVVREVKAANPRCVFLCDPVLGDQGKLYVPAEVVAVYRDEVVGHADIVTPNQFEAETLTGIPIRTLADARSVAQWFHNKGVAKVVISSMEFPEDPTYADRLVLLGSVRPPTTDGPPQQFTIMIPSVRDVFTGTGDTLSALLLGWDAAESDFAAACEKALAGLQAICVPWGLDTGVFCGPQPSGGCTTGPPLRGGEGTPPHPSQAVARGPGSPPPGPAPRLIHPTPHPPSLIPSPGSPRDIGVVSGGCVGCWVRFLTKGGHPPSPPLPPIASLPRLLVYLGLLPSPETHPFLSPSLRHS